MGRKVEKLPNPAAFLREPFHVLATTLLALLLPLSFLLASRLSLSGYFFSSLAPADHALEPIALLFSLFFDTNPTLLLVLLSILGIATLVHCLAGHIDVLGKLVGSVHRPGLYLAWVLLCASQICLLLGIGGSLVLGVVKGSSFSYEPSSFRKALLFIGLHETMANWCRVVVKPVVDDMVLGFPREERWTERAAAATSFGGLWWWRMREEVESLVVVPEVKMELLMGVGVADFLAWWLYYLTVTIGMVQIVKGFMRLGMTFSRRFTGNSGDDSKYFPGPGPGLYGVDRHQWSVQLDHTSTPLGRTIRIDVL
ncbi:uncharacterized protein LOC115742568 [Rhodamnia argentea]|uniref:Uncharacterized protein LOC115742568 n=1 Tax=Rhodamnia argentea TaxID=178133 RepID=A0A8B8PDE9_9MYRT|nr:uncharacterized protein LOC115742568 [Rhodamnia argentea]